MVVALLVVILLGGIIYFTLPKGEDSSAPTGTTTETTSVPSQNENGTPDSSASSDEIIDYIVDDLGSDETKAAEATIDGTTPASEQNAAAGVNTDF